MSYLKTIQILETASKEAEEKVSRIFKIPVSEIFYRTRSKKYSQARFAIWYILNEIYKIDVYSIGQKYGFHHTTVIHGIKRAKELGIDKELVEQAVDNTRNNLGTTSEYPKLH